PAVPESAAHGTCESVFSGKHEKFATWSHDSSQFLQAGSRIGKMLQDPAADDSVKNAVRIRQSRKVGGCLGDPVGVEPIAGALQHSLGIIESGDQRIGIGMVKEESRIPAVAAAGIQDSFASSDVESVGTNQPAGEGFVTREESGDRRQFSGQAVVMV